APADRASRRGIVEPRVGREHGTEQVPVLVVARPRVVVHHSLHVKLVRYRAVITHCFSFAHSLNRRTLPTLVRGSASISRQSRGRAADARLRSAQAARSLTAGGFSGSRGTT